MTELALAGALSCSRAEGPAVRRKKKKKRSLWGKDSGGGFRTRGNGSVATVRGTEWRTEDTCAGRTSTCAKAAVSVWPRRGGRSKLVAPASDCSRRARDDPRGQDRGALVALVALVAALTPALERAELATIDARFGVRGTQPAGVGGRRDRRGRRSRSSTRSGRSRGRLHARMIDRLREAGVRQIVYDVQFTEPSEDPDDDLALYDAVGPRRAT